MSLQQLIDVWKAHGTKILGFLSTVVSTALIIEGLIPEAHLKYWLFFNLLLGGTTVKRGFTNDKLQATANKQVGMVRMLMLAALLAIAVPVTTSIYGCAPVTQLSFDQQLQLSIDSTTEMTRAVTSAYDAKLISRKQAAAYLELVKNARTLFDIAIETKDSDIRSAEGQLRLANDILLQLQRYLNEVES